MRNSSLTWGISAAILVAMPVGIRPIEAATNVERARAAKLVDETLEREARQGIEDRGASLGQALELTPVYDPAWWQSGFVYDAKGREWLRWDEVAPQAAKDATLAEYRKTREKCPETVDGQVRLAQWCVKHKLEEQARAHWTRVLEFDPEHAEARQGLGFRKIDGRWVDERDISQVRAVAHKASTSAPNWIARLQKLRDRLADDNSAKRKKALTQLLAIRDPAAADAIDVVFCRESSDLALQGIEVLKNIRAAEAASVLAWHAVFSPWPDVRRAATTALQSEEKHDFVPLLLALAESAIAPQPQDSGTPFDAGTAAAPPQFRTVFRLDHVASIFCWNTVQQLKEHPYWWTIPNMNYNPATPVPVTKGTTASGKQGPTTFVAQQHEYFSTWNGRVQNRITQTTVKVDQQKLTPVGQIAIPAKTPTVPAPMPTVVSPGDPDSTAPILALAEATGEKGPRSVSEWWDWWYDYNEVYHPSANGANAKGAPDKAGQPQRGDCLASGTLVMTEMGLTPVEKVAVGDRVFCCDAETGCLAMKPILRKTVRPDGRLIMIRAGGKEFQASGGQVFWVAGQGWIKARDLRAGMQLHTIHGTAPVESTAPGELQTSVGLVAADYHTFFIGKGMVLTHDNTIRPPTDRIVPGLAPKAPQALVSAR
jgi:hypothetical protein